MAEDGFNEYPPCYIHFDYLDIPEDELAEMTHAN